MTAKEFLSYPEKLRKEIACDADHLAALRSIVSDCTSHLSFSGGHSNPDSRRDRFENIVAEITEEQAQKHPKKNMLTKALGGTSFVEPDLTVKGFVTDDIILICSDGLTNMLSDNQIYSIVTKDYKNAAKKLVEEANNHGGIDNITVVLLKK